MKAVIVAGGKGTRIESLGKGIPKGLVKIAGKTVIEHQLDVLKRYQINDVIMCLGYKSEQITEYFADGSGFNLNIEYSIEQKALGTAGCLEKIFDKLNDDFIIIYGDVIFDINIDAFVQHHNKNNGIATLFAHPNDHPHDSDILEINQQGVVTDIYYKNDPRPEYHHNMVNAAFYILTPQIKKYIEKDSKQDFMRDVFPRAIKDDQKLVAYITSEYIKDMGTADRFHEIESDILSGLVSTKNLAHMQKAVFLDRDGVLNEEVDQLSDPEELVLLPESQRGLSLLNRSAYLSIVITNQPMVAKGFCDIETVEKINMKLEMEFGRKGLKLDDIYYCPHHPERGFEGENPEYKIECDCRKPRIGMLQKARKRYNLAFNESFMIGDSTRDLETASRAGVTSVLVRTGYGGKDGTFPVTPDYTFDDLHEAAEFIVNGQFQYQDICQDICKQISSTFDLSTKQRLIIVVGGQSRVGKTTFVKVLKEQLELTHDNVKVIEMDHWIVEHDQRKANSTVFERYDIEKFDHDIDSYLSGGQLVIRPYDPLTRARADSEIVIDPKIPEICIITGTIVLSGPLAKVADHRIFLQIDDELQKERFFAFYRWKGLDDSEIQRLYGERVEERVAVEETKQNADIVIDLGPKVKVVA